MKAIKDFRPALIFLLKFVSVYLIGNILYGIFISSYNPKPDPATIFVTRQTNHVLNACGYLSILKEHEQTPTVMLKENGRTVVSVFEGCNGINVMIVFVAFIVAFGGNYRRMLWFIPASLILIHAVNLLRLSILFHISVADSEWFYYFHKYLFTATLYVLIFSLWALWVVKVNVSVKK